MRFPSTTSASAARGALIAVGAILVLAACGPSGAPTGAAANPEPPTRPASAAGYLAPPDLDAAQTGPSGLLLQGHAPAGAQVNLASPEGLHLRALAGPDGRWAITAPSPVNPAMYALSANLGGRTVRAEGAVLTLPKPGPLALLVRAGFAALPLGAPMAAPVIVAVDFDHGGGAAAAGLARPKAQVRLSVDGAPAGIGNADETGRFAVLAANRPLTPGQRRLQIDTDGGRAEVQLAVSEPAPLGQAVYRATRQPDGWRIDWTPAGGGVQTTMVFDPTLPSSGNSPP